MSMVGKSEAKRSFIPLLRTFNWWLGANKQLLDYLQCRGVRFILNVYERLCTDPDQFVDG